MITKLSHATIYVNDHAKAYDFYVNKLGFKVKTDMTMDNGFRWLTVTAPQQPDLEIVLYLPTVGMLKEEVVEHYRALLANNAMGGGVLDTEDIAKTYEELKAKGVQFMQAPEKRFYGIEALMQQDGVHL